MTFFLYFTQHDVPVLKAIRLTFHSYTHTYQTQHNYISHRMVFLILKPKLSWCLVPTTEIYKLNVVVYNLFNGE
jgi:hypothetical protein